MGICHAYMYGVSQVLSSWKSASRRGVEKVVAEVEAVGRNKVTR